MLTKLAVKCNCLLQKAIGVVHCSFCKDNERFKDCFPYVVTFFAVLEGINFQYSLLYGHPEFLDDEWNVGKIVYF